MWSVVVRELSDGEEVWPVVLLIGTIAAKVAFERLVRSFCLAVSFGMISRGKLQLHVQTSSERSNEVGSEQGTSIGDYVGGDTMFRKDVEEIELGKAFGLEITGGWDKQRHLREAVDDDENGVISSGVEFGDDRREFDNEIERNRFPRTIWNRQLLQ